MKNALWSGIVAAAILCWSAPAFAQATQTGSVNVSANVNAKAKLTLGAATVTFADADPDTTPSMTAAALSVDVKARTSDAGNVVLTVSAGGDLDSGSATIAISNLTWTAAGAGFQAGTANTTDQTVGSWTGGGTYTGSQTYALANSWDYATGTYAVTLTYTLSAP